MLYRWTEAKRVRKGACPTLNPFCQRIRGEERRSTPCPTHVNERTIDNFQRGAKANAAHRRTLWCASEISGLMRVYNLVNCANSSVQENWCSGPVLSVRMKQVWKPSRRAVDSPPSPASIFTNNHLAGFRTMGCTESSPAEQAFQQAEMSDELPYDPEADDLGSDNLFVTNSSSVSSLGMCECSHHYSVVAIHKHSVSTTRKGLYPASCSGAVERAAKVAAEDAASPDTFLKETENSLIQHDVEEDSLPCKELRAKRTDSLKGRKMIKRSRQRSLSKMEQNVDMHETSSSSCTDSDPSTLPALLAAHVHSHTIKYAHPSEQKAAAKAAAEAVATTVAVAAAEAAARVALTERSKFRKGTLL